MDGQFADDSLRLEPENIAKSPKRSRRAVQKRVVSVPIGETDGPRPKGVSEGAPPSDSWAWRKYGQKPIKGSPYPRGYYRCSSSKGCPARKQVERSRVDPTMLVVTYSCEHNHPWPVPKNSHLQQHQNNGNVNQTAASKNPVVEEDPDPIRQQSPPESADQDEKFADLIGEEPALMLPDDFWYSDVGSTSSTSPPLLYGPIFGASAQLAPDEFDGVGGGEEEDSLFAGLGELPEYSMVFRRGNLDGRMTATAWCGTTS